MDAQRLFKSFLARDCSRRFSRRVIFAGLVAYDKTRWPVQASTIFVSLQKGVGAELEEMASILETEIPDYLF